MEMIKFGPDLDAFLKGWHSELARQDILSPCTYDNWTQCPDFAPVRIRSDRVTHYVVMSPADPDDSGPLGWAVVYAYERAGGRIVYDEAEKLSFSDAYLLATSAGRRAIANPPPLPHKTKPGDPMAYIRQLIGRLVEVPGLSFAQVGCILGTDLVETVAMLDSSGDTLASIRAYLLAPASEPYETPDPASPGVFAGRVIEMARLLYSGAEPEEEGDSYRDGVFEFAAQILGLKPNVPARVRLAHIINGGYPLPAPHDLREQLGLPYFLPTLVRDPGE